MTLINGLHHITAVAADPQRNVDFYAGVLGLRLVKKTVNQDDPYTYHLYYGDALARPGFIIDESSAHLGESLLLTQAHEPMRASIEAALPALTLPDSAVNAVVTHL